MTPNFPDKSLEFKFVVDAPNSPMAVDYLHAHTQLSKSLIKKIMNAGGVWLQNQGKGTIRRLRKATHSLKKGDVLEFYFDPQIVVPDVEKLCRPIFENQNWGVWYKASGILSEGTRYGDEGSLLRYLEKTRPLAFLVHRLDRETSGLIVVAYKKSICAQLSQMWAQSKVEKYYLARVRGEIKNLKIGLINMALDGKNAVTEIMDIQTCTDSSKPEALIKVRLHTGRYHQIRRHLLALQCPILGDPRYGEGNKDLAGLCLTSSGLNLRSPEDGKWLSFKIPEDTHPHWAINFHRED